MFTKKVREQTGLEKAVDKVLTEMQRFGSTEDEYAKMTIQLERLYKLKEIDTPKRVSPDTMALIAGNLAGILLILGYEHANVLTSKALNFVVKLR